MLSCAGIKINVVGAGPCLQQSTVAVKESLLDCYIHFNCSVHVRGEGAVMSGENAAESLHGEWIAVTRSCIPFATRA